MKNARAVFTALNASQLSVCSSCLILKCSVLDDVDCFVFSPSQVACLLSLSSCRSATLLKVASERSEVLGSAPVNTKIERIALLVSKIM